MGAIRPLLTMMAFTVIFGCVAQLPSDGTVPYALMAFAGKLPWFLFSTILSVMYATTPQVKIEL